MSDLEVFRSQRAMIIEALQYYIDQLKADINSAPADEIRYGAESTLEDAHEALVQIRATA